jgi:hypothetical protein
MKGGMRAKADPRSAIALFLRGDFIAQRHLGDPSQIIRIEP